MHPGGGDLDAAAHLVLDLARLRGLAVQGERLVEVVLAVVALHVADDQELALDRLAGLAARQHVELRGPLDGERQPVGVREPGVVAGVGRLDLLDPADRHDRDVTLHGGSGTRGAAADDADRPAEGGHRVVDVVGEGVQVVDVPGRGLHGRQRSRRGQAEAEGAPQQPLHLGGGGGASLHAGQGDGLGGALEVGEQPRVLDVARSPPYGGDHAVAGRAGREPDAEEDLLLGHRLVAQVLLHPDEVVAPRAAATGGQRGRGDRVEAARPRRGGVGLAGHPQVQAVPRQPGQRVGRAEEQLLALGVGPERPRLGGQHEPRPGVVVGEAEVSLDVAQREPGPRDALDVTPVSVHRCSSLGPSPPTAGPDARSPAPAARAPRPAGGGTR